MKNYRVIDNVTVCLISFDPFYIDNVTVFPRSLDPFYMATYYIDWVTTSWKYRSGTPREAELKIVIAWYRKRRVPAFL